MIYPTKGIVLRTIKFGDTSVVASIFTEMFGIQSYLVNGIRTSGKTAKAAMFQPTSILEMEVYHSELKNLQRIKEFKWAYLYRTILSDVTKNAVGVYMVELLQKCLKQPEKHTALFQFIENAFMQLDTARDTVTANFPIYFSLKLVQFFGFSIRNNFSQQTSILDLQEGLFVRLSPSHSYFLGTADSQRISELLRISNWAGLADLRLNKTTRTQLLQALQIFYALHFQEFGTMKTLPILQEILS